MKKMIAAAALALLGATGAAQAAIVTVPFQYAIDFVDGTVATEIGITAGGLYNGVAEYDDAGILPGDQVVTTSLTLNFGNFNFTNANDNFGGAVISVGSSNNLTSLLFETTLTLTGSTGAGEYLLSFNGMQGQLTPSGDTLDFKATASVVPSAVPLPAALPLLLGGLGMFGMYGRRRQQ